ncbi:MAG: DMT family transporter [Euzebyales bacterium]|nr:DMT family transporter [Euzebyales bacterium]
MRRCGLELALIAVTAVWGATFPLVKAAVERTAPASFNSVRFLLAAVALGVVALPGLRGLGRDGLRHGALLGVALFAGYAFQTVGLQYTTASNAGFVTGMFVVFTPLLSALVLRRAPGGAAVGGVVLATVGLGLLSLTASLVPRYGDVLVLCCALSFAAHIVGLGAWSARHDPVALTAVQLATAGVLHSVVAAGSEAGRVTLSWDAGVVAVVALTALVASAAAFWIQTAAQRVIPPTRTAIILTMEPVFAGIFGFALLGERLGPRAWLGCACIVAGMLLAELRGGAPTAAPPGEGEPRTLAELRADQRDG